MPVEFRIVSWASWGTGMHQTEVRAVGADAAGSGVRTPVMRPCRGVCSRLSMRSCTTAGGRTCGRVLVLMAAEALGTGRSALGRDLAEIGHVRVRSPPGRTRYSHAGLAALKILAGPVMPSVPKKSVSSLRSPAARTIR